MLFTESIYFSNKKFIFKFSDYLDLPQSSLLTEIGQTSSKAKHLQFLIKKMLVLVTLLLGQEVKMFGYRESGTSASTL